MKKTKQSKRKIKKRQTHVKERRDPRNHIPDEEAFDDEVFYTPADARDDNGEPLDLYSFFTKG